MKSHAAQTLLHFNNPSNENPRCFFCLIFHEVCQRKLADLLLSNYCVTTLEAEERRLGGGPRKVFNARREKLHDGLD